MIAYNMTESKLLLGLLLLSLACNNPKVPAVNGDTVADDQAMPALKAEDSDADQGLMKRIDSIADVIRDGSYETRRAFFPPNSIRDTLKTTLFFKDGKALRIQYSTFEDGGAAVGNEDLYFDKSLGVIRGGPSGNDAFYECVTLDGRYIRFRKSILDGTFKKADVPPGATDGLMGLILRTVHDLRQLYPDIAFDVPEIPLRGDARLKMISAVPLYEGPDTNAHKIRLLQDRAVVGFIRASDSIGSFRDKRWIWYFVKSDTDSGWIVGHPDFVQELTDENAED
ncbi:hypothetical protein L3C95_20370 [Chitinophaga filiformis]|uniref:hypothetical protein n=1 Tax=Chitinophaga filiformis TaxID=104663 RepID=UPI001F1F2818|nr:hypothetical protein [Chitinophaga filiformis]MCF6405271.1 hypothetical protein [Chitinophaga filiformis]